MSADSSVALSQEEIDALLNGMSGDSEVAAAPAPADPKRIFDVAGQERIIRGRMPTLEIVMERFARNIRLGLFGMLRRNPEVSLGPVTVQKFGTFLRDIVVPTNFNVVSIKPLRGSGLVICEPALIFAIIDALFGGNGKMQFRIEGRDFSVTEQRIIRRLLDVVITEYQKAWAGIYPIELDYQRAEMLPQFANVAQPTELVVSCTCRFEFGNSGGELHIILPYATLEPIRDILFSTMQVDSNEPDRRWSNQLKSQLQSAHVDVAAELGSAPATIEQLMAMRAGDFIELRLQKTVEATVHGVPFAECHYGISNGRYALKVDRLLTTYRADSAPARDLT